MDYRILLKKYWLALVAILFTVAIGLGLLQRNDPGFQESNDTAQADSKEKVLWSFYNKGQELAGKVRGNEPQKSSVTFLAVGDIMLSRKVALAMQKSSELSLPFSNMAKILRSVDFSFGNLESPTNGSNNFNPGATLVFNAPEDFLAGLSEYGFKVLNLANNHAFDQGKTGLERTIKYLNENNIKHTGAGLDKQSAWEPAIVEQNNIKICFIGASYASINDGGKILNNYVARIEDTTNLKQQIENSKSVCDFIVATMHAGTEYTRTPNQAQADFAHAAIEYGADMVIGHHPHWIQTIEKYCPNTSTVLNSSSSELEESGDKVCSNPKYIFYSLGNFIFDQEWSQETKEGLTLKIQVSKVCHPDRSASGVEGSLKGQNLSDSSASLGMTCGNALQGSKTQTILDSIELIPVIIENYSTPRPATEVETKKILKKIQQTESILK